MGTRQHEVTGGRVSELPRRAPEPPFEAFIAANGHALLRLAFLLTGNRHDADDLLQDTLTDIYRHWTKVSQSHVPHEQHRSVLDYERLWWPRHCPGHRWVCRGSRTAEFQPPHCLPGLPGLVEMALDQAYQYWMGTDRELIVRTREGTTLLVFERR